MVQVDLEHLARPQTSGGQHVGRIDIDGADLGREQQAVVARHVIASGTQSVAVERRTEGVTVGEGDGGRSVPGLHQHGLIGIVRAAHLGQVLVVVPWLGHKHRDGTRKRAAVHDEKLEHVVENRGIGALAVDDRHHTLKVVLKNRRVQVRLACANPVDITL